MTMMSSVTLYSSGSSWVMKIIAWMKPLSIMSRSILMTIFWLVTSSAEEGSSAISTLGFRIVEMAMTTRCFMPPESSTACLSSASRGSPSSWNRPLAIS